MDVNQVYELANFIIGKNIGGGYFSPDEFNLTIKVAEAGYFDFLKGEYQKYQLQRPVAVVSFSQNQDIRTSLAPLIYGAVLNVNSTTGVAPFPSDFEIVDAMWSVYGIYNIHFAQQDRLNSYYRSSIDPIAQNPIYLIQHEGFHFYPENIGQARMSYVRVVPYMHYGYTTDPTTALPVYSPSTSKQPIWSDTDIFEVIVRALQMVGVNLQTMAVQQYAQQIKQIGQ
jgi:hypothetical protein